MPLTILGIRVQEWFDACREKKLPPEVPRQPNYMYRGKGWISYADFLGIEEPEAPTRSSDDDSYNSPS